MAHSSSEKAPIEIWERILQEALSFDSNLALAVTCTSDTYLAYKATHKIDGYPSPPLESYIQSESTRKNLRIVCRAWKKFIDDAKYRDRWVRLTPYMSPDEICYSTWDLPSRIDIEFRRAGSTVILPSKPQVPMITHYFQTWGKWQSNEHKAMRVARVEMLLYMHDFDSILEAFCGVSEALPYLRSFGIAIPSCNPWTLHKISDAFSNLTHLTLQMGQEIFNLPPAITSTSQINQLENLISFKSLEVFFLQPNPGCVDLALWTLPKLHTIAVNPLPKDWEKTLYPFLYRHSKTIESLDLEDYSYMGMSKGIPPQDVILPTSFWEEFNQLRLLRIDLRYAVIPGAPKKDHPLGWLVDTNPMKDVASIQSLEKPSWRITEETYAKVVTLFKQRTENLCVDSLGDATSSLLREMVRNGVNLVNNNGETLI